MADMMVNDTLSKTSLKSITNKSVYAEMTSSFPPPKVVRESGRDYENVWARPHGPVVCVRARDVMFLLLHNKLPVAERLFRIRLRNDPYCLSCFGAEVADAEHFFCFCEKVRRIWDWVKKQVVKHIGQQQQVTDWELLNPFFPSSAFDQRNVWLISNYVLFVWENISIRGAEVKLEQFFGFLTYKYREHQAMSSTQLKQMDGIS